MAPPDNIRPPSGVLPWLVREWPYAALFAAGFLIALSPVIRSLGLPLFLVFLQLPIYMVHQFEEHDQDRFRKFANQLIGGGREVFTPLAIFVINSVGVWGVDLIVLYLAWFVDPALGLIACYLAVINGVSHILIALVTRKYNPGLWSSLILFLPIGLWGIAVISEASEVGWRMQVLAGTVAVLVHVVILIYVKLRLLKLKL